VPDDNPFYNGAPISPRDYVFTLGHRNVQGIAWGNVNGTGILYAAEHGDKSDDEVNILTGGTNFGWNRVAGYCDGNYNGMTLGGYSGVNENAFCAATPTYRDPLATLFTATSSQISAFSSDYLSWPTVAPSSVEFYSGSKIPGWQNSVLVSCLKAGRVYRLKLGNTGQSVTPFVSGRDTTSYFHGEGRFRDLALSPDGLRIFLACDASGQTSGPTGGFNGGGRAPPNAGAILEFRYTGMVLPVTDKVLERPGAPEKGIRIFPNPANSVVHISVEVPAAKPLFIQLYNHLGQPVKSLRSSRTGTTMDLSGLSSGLYYMEIKDAHGKLLKKEKISRL
jgi:hypothetical protein